MPSSAPGAAPASTPPRPPEASSGSGGEGRSSFLPGSAWLVLCCAVVPLVALLAAAPQAFTRFHPPRLAATALALLLAVALATFGVAGPWRRRGPRVQTLAARSALLWIGWSALSLCWSPAPGAGLLTLAAWALGVIWIALLRDVLSAEILEPRFGAMASLGGVHLALLVSLLAGGAVLAALALWQHAGHLRLGLHRVTGTIGNPNHLAVALVALLPAALWLGRTARESRRPVFAPAGQLLALTWAVLVLAGIHATGCHAAWLAVAALVLFALLSWPSLSCRRRLALAGGAAAAALALGAVALPRAAFLAGVQGRLLITRFGLDVVAQAPLPGTGLGGFAHRVAWIQGAHLAREAGPWSPLLDAHDQALMVAGETGLVGLALALAALVLVLRRIGRRRQHPAAQAALAAWVGLAVFSLSETMLRDVGVLMVAMTWLAVGLGARRAFPGEASEEPGRLLAPLWRLLPVGLLGVIVFAVVGDARSDHLHARGLALLARAGNGADRTTLLRVLREYQQARVSALDRASLELDRALVLQALGDPGRAARAARAAFEARPGPDRALLLGDLAAAADHLDEAIGWYRRAVALHPRYARARNNLGVILLRAGRPRAGCSTLRRALSLRPFDPIIRGNWRMLCRSRALDEGLSRRSVLRALGECG